MQHEELKMKKTSLFLAIVLLFAILTGCNNKDDFVEVAAITYTIDGEKVTEESKAYLALGEAEEITYEGYYSGTLSTYRLDDKPRSIILTHDQKTVDNIQGLNDDHKGEYVYYYTKVGNEYKYYKAELLGLYYQYVHVKIVDDDTIVIISGKGKTTYNVSSYRITEFSKK